MKAYFDSIEKEVPEQLQQVFLNRRDTAVITIDMHDGHLSTDPDCPCPSPRGREIIEPLNHFMNEARALGLPIIHVRSTLRKGGADEKLFPSAWRMVFPVTVGEIPNIAEHAIEGTRFLPHRPRAAAAQSGHPPRGADRLHDRLLRYQHCIRCRKPRFPRRRAARPDPRLRAPRRACATHDLAASGTCRGFGCAARRVALSGLNAYLKLHINKKTR